MEYTNEVNVLGLLVFCTGFGVILSVLGDQARLMINFFIVLDAVSFTIKININSLKNVLNSFILPNLLGKNLSCNKWEIEIN